MGIQVSAPYGEQPKGSWRATPGVNLRNSYVMSCIICVSLFCLLSNLCNVPGKGTVSRRELCVHGAPGYVAGAKRSDRCYSSSTRTRLFDTLSAFYCRSQGENIAMNQYYNS